MESMPAEGRPTRASVSPRAWRPRFPVPTRPIPTRGCCDRRASRNDRRRARNGFRRARRAGPRTRHAAIRAMQTAAIRPVQPRRITDHRCSKALAPTLRKRRGRAAHRPRLPYLAAAVHAAALPDGSDHFRLQHLIQRRKKQVVLAPGAERDSQPPLLAERRARPHDHPALGQPGNDRVLVALAQ